MRRLLSTFILAGATATAAAPAYADGFLSPYIGVTFGGDSVENNTTYGAALGFTGDKTGFEIDWGYTPEFFGENTPGTDGTLTTFMANVLLGGRRRGFSPYFAFGAGLIRTDIEVIDDIVEVDAANNSFGGNFGGGFFAGGRNFTVRADVRYFRAFDFDDGLDLNLDFLEDTLGFWRGTVGIGLMW